MSRRMQHLKAKSRFFNLIPVFQKHIRFRQRQLRADHTGKIQRRIGKRRSIQLVHIELYAVFQPWPRIKHVIKVRMRQQHRRDLPAADRAANRRILRARIDQHALIGAIRPHDISIDIQRAAGHGFDIQLHQNVLLESISSVTGPSLISETFISV